MNRSRILVIDDEPEICQMMRLALEPAYDVTTVPDGFIGRQSIDSSVFDVIIADQNLPGPNGIELLDHARKAQPSAIRILMTAAKHFDDLCKAVNVAKIHHFVAKPLRLVEIRSAIEIALNQRNLQMENQTLVSKLRLKNDLLQSALLDIKAHEAKLEAEVKSRTEDLRIANRELEDLACRDSLTGLFNRRFFDSMLTAEFSRAKRQNQALGLLFLDVDHFKNYNDKLGHPAGDSALRAVGGILSGRPQNQCELSPPRKSDFAARYGGEEFVLILPGTNKDGAMVRADRIRRSVEQYSFFRGDVQPLGKVTISVGVSSFPEDASSEQDLVHSADQSALQAKQQGRNRIWSHNLAN
jgi:diguanylate cyclase (GGDEF)-like protein